jgi:gamma-glutamyl-gamma-aminobutyrate hydrolase PuuD
VQWHPETVAATEPDQQRIFDAFAAAAAAAVPAVPAVAPGARA